MEFVARLTAPSYSNKYYIKNTHGGYNPCILISGNSCLPNCVGYANGRSRELSGNQCQMPTCNAKDWWNATKYAKGSQPKLGAVMAWTGKYGHVGVVEQIGANTITVSMSSYGGARFYLRTFKKGAYNYNGLTFLGFIYNPYVTDPKPKPQPQPAKPAANTSGYKVGDVVVPTILRDIKGHSLKQWDKQYTITAINGNNVTLSARGQVWATLPVGNIRKVGSSSSNVSAPLKVGDKVKVIKAVDFKGHSFKVYYPTYTVMELKGNRAVIGVNGVVTAAINTANIRKA